MKNIINCLKQLEVIIKNIEKIPQIEKRLKSIETELYRSYKITGAASQKNNRPTSRQILKAEEGDLIRGLVLITPKGQKAKIKKAIAKKLKITNRQIGSALAYLAPGMQARFKRKIPDKRLLNKLCKKYGLLKLI